VELSESYVDGVKSFEERNRNVKRRRRSNRTRGSKVRVEGSFRERIETVPLIDESTWPASVFTENGEMK
jgi:hypothetical protein